MCSVSFLPNSDGFDLAMNRDEQISRIAALPPAYFRHEKVIALYPSEPGNCTWIGVNEAGMTFGLINWHSQPQCDGRETVSRGKVIPALLAAENSGEAEKRLMDLPLNRMNPFRLILVALPEQCLQEWRWNRSNLEKTILPWTRHHWFSSGLDEMEANRVRRQTCERAAMQSMPGSAAWLRDLHRSHYPKKGPFSICMHRPDAHTVSYAEISTSRSRSAVAMTYHDGPPCTQGPFVTNLLNLRINAVFQMV